ncbi:hypothetical protein LTS10_004704 [Elasticomyces elasticus]|nr:hypothetical protein LTS10_004704 [Elasticomyces elasticus]
MSSHGPLLDLPPELLELIASHVESRDLTQWRLSCITLNVTAARVFARTFFQNVTFILADAYSMLMFVNIAKEKHLNMCLQQISLSLAVPAIEDVTESYRSCQWWERPYTRRERANKRMRRKEHADLVEQNEKIFNLEAQRNFLMVALQHLNEAGVAPGIVSTGFEDTRLGDKPKNFQRLMRGGGQYCLHYRIDEAEALEAIYYAIIVMKYPVERLILGSEYFPICRGAFGITPYKGWFENLRMLEVTVAPAPMGWLCVPELEMPDLQIQKDATLSFLHLFAAAQQLTSLSLSISGGDAGWHAGTFLALAWTTKPETEDLMFLPKLVSLHLSGHRIEPETLFTFVTRRKETLREIELSGIRDMGKSHTNIETGIRQALDEHGPAARVTVVDSYNGTGWVPPHVIRGG